MIKHYYAVKKGRKSGVVVKSWNECEALVKGFPGAIYKGFSLYQKDQAEKFAKSGSYKNQQIKKKKVIYDSSTKGECLERKSYTDPFTRVFYKDRCVRRYFKTTVGEFYKPHIGNSIPW